MGDHARTPRIVCVLKSGGVYDEAYVRRLYKGVSLHCSLEYEFVCLTDLPLATLPRMQIFRLETNLPAWWAKLEIFRLDGPCLYFDLDTTIVSPIDDLLIAICRPFRAIYMLRPFKATEMYASGIMGWQGNWEWILEQFEHEDIRSYLWDQRYISSALLHEGVRPFLVQDFLKGVYSFKHHCQEALPYDASVVCFHGNPRPHQVQRDWIQ